MVTKKYVYHIVRGAVSMYYLWWVSPELSGLQAVFFHELQLQQQLELPSLPKFAQTANSITGEVE